MSALDGRTWIVLAEGAEVVVRHAISSREFLLRGAGHFLPCRGGLEQVLVASGRVKSAPGTGVRPGAEFSIATPFGSITYGDADLDSHVEARRWQIDVRRGEVATDSAPGSQGLPKLGLRGPNGSATVTGTPDPVALTANCEREAEQAAQSAERLLSSSDRTKLGADASQQLLDRRRARAACAIAESSLDRASDPALRARLNAQVIAAERRWRTVPLPKSLRPGPISSATPPG
jgi:hypothetical protein